ncbi:CheR family methyltransferase [Brevundimonas sp. R86498]|uniref:CheR family methyltransferase n=1 Tax=Brevundimonas sp. R86498 TaxID=3093845 RepID=UPI0037CAB015
MSGARPAGAEFHLTGEGLERICDYLYRRTGMTFGEKKRYYIERRVADRMKAVGTESFTVYFGVLRADPDEGEALINAFTVNETYFYREEHQFRCLTESLLPELIRSRAPGDRIRVWSNPCSSGEEPYSIALWLLEHWRLVDAYNVEIHGSDIDSRALAEAAEGQYGERALSRLPPDVLSEYFEPAKHRRRKIIDDLRESIVLSPANLIEADSMRPHGQFDVIFCRNVLIYFDEASRQAAAANLFQALAPGGFLCLGHTESMSRISDAFVLRRFRDAIVYQRPAV